MKVSPIGAIAKVQSGFAFKSAEFKPTGVRLLRNTNILPQRIYWDDLACLEMVEYGNYLDYQLLIGDILLSLDRPIISTGIKTARVSVDDTPALLVQRVGRFRIDQSKVDVEYLYAFIQSSRFIREISGHEQSLGVPHISPSQVEAIEIPLPELSEQRRISANLKVQLAEVEAARKAAQAQAKELESLADAIVFDSLRDGPTAFSSLGDVLDEIKRGIGSEWENFPVLGATRDGLAPARELPGKQALKYKPVHSGTVFYNPMRILIGSIAFVDDDDDAGITSPDYVVLRGKPGIVVSRWLYYWMRSSLGVRCINSLARGAVRERMLFNRLAEGTIELPSFAAQQKAATALKEIKKLQHSIALKLAEIDLLPQRLLAQAFES